MPAPNDAAAAQYYPAIYWYAMLKIPGADQFGGKSDIPEKAKQSDWLNLMKNNGCIGCHQLGGLATRTLPKGLGEFKSSEEAWARRVQSGQAGPLMVNIIAGELNSTPIHYFADWTDRIAEGELPRVKPQRPQGAERNIVITTWDWADEKHYLHDEISTDKRNPTVNGYGKLFGSPEYSTDMIPILDPVKNSVTRFHAPVRDADMPESLGPGHAAALKPLAPSPYWGNEQIWDTHINNHNSMMDGNGNVWLAAAVRGVKDPDFCGKNSELTSAKLFPLDGEPPPARDARSEDDEIHLRRHLLRAPTICSSASTPTIRCGRRAAAAAAWSAGSTPRCSWKPATPPSRKAGRR